MAVYGEAENDPPLSKLLRFNEMSVSMWHVLGSH